MESPKLTIEFESGTLRLSGWSDAEMNTLPETRYDPRTRSWRSEARYYRKLVELLRERKVAYEDQARTYDIIDWHLKVTREPFPHQIEAIEVWEQQGRRGLVILPTGTGKTFTAVLAIHRTRRPTLILVPTIDLLNQWYSQLVDFFQVPVGLIGGGNYDVQPLTVTTYQSAHEQIERIGNRFGLMIFDECHHLPGPTYSMAAVGSLAPFRLGLTATPERADGMEMVYPELIGPIVYRKEIQELSGDFLAEYRTERVYVQLSEQEKQEYLTAKECYRNFILDRNISMGAANGWQRFIIEASRSPKGYEAFKAYQSRKRIERTASAKFEQLERLLRLHASDRSIIFTADNATVYRIAREYLVPAITHQTKAKERKEILTRFHSGEFTVVVTSQVLNEGVDVPAASVGIVLSGSSTIRENVQRLGRILRKQPDKQAILYEIVARETSEEFSSDRRRQHGAFR
jgi:superfamily II DNA or RNA helicase